MRSSSSTPDPIPCTTPLIGLPRSIIGSTVSQSPTTMVPMLYSRKLATANHSSVLTSVNTTWDDASVSPVENGQANNAPGMRGTHRGIVECALRDSQGGLAGAHCGSRGGVGVDRPYRAGSFCTDSGRAIENAGEPPINKPNKQETARHPEPEWLHTLPRGLYHFTSIGGTPCRSGGFGFSDRIMNYPGGMPGDVGLFITWPKAPSKISLP